MNNLILLKFGGTSVTNGFENIKNIIYSKINDYKIVVVLSAFKNVTNILEKNKDNIIHKLRKIQDPLIDKYFDKYKTQVKREINFLYKQLNYIFKYNNKKIILSYGEKFSTTIYYYYLLENKLNNCLIWSEYLICTNNNNNCIFPLLEDTTKRINKNLIPKLKKFNIILTTGFVASDINYEKTILTRNGSDYSATIIGSCLNVKQIIIYKDVDSILTADPRKVKNAKQISIINYDILSELCYFGSSILHSKCLTPLKNKNINLLLLNTYNQKSLGTMIVPKYNTYNEIDAITSITDHSLLTIKGKGLNGCNGILLKILTIISKLSVNIPFFTQASSEQTICLCIQKKYIKLIETNILLDFKHEIKNNIIDNISFQKNICIITVVGYNMINNIGIAGKIFTILGNCNVNIIAISQGSSERSISFIIDKKYEIISLNAIHTLIK